jgi:hypothetical protein
VIKIVDNDGKVIMQIDDEGNVKVFDAENRKLNDDPNAIVIDAQPKKKEKKSE